MNLTLKDVNENTLLEFDATSEAQIISRFNSNSTLIVDTIKSQNVTIFHLTFDNDLEDRDLFMIAKRQFLQVIEARLPRFDDPKSNDPTEKSSFYSVSESITWKTRVATVIFAKMDGHPDLIS